MDGHPAGGAQPSVVRTARACLRHLSALEFRPAITLPRPVASAATTVAAASLGIYLTHFGVLPLLSIGAPRAGGRGGRRRRLVVGAHHRSAEGPADGRSTQPAFLYTNVTVCEQAPGA